MAIGLADNHLEVAKTPPPAYGCAWRLTSVSLMVSLSKTLTCKIMGGTSGGGTETRRMAAGMPMECAIQRRLRTTPVKHLFAGVHKCKVFWQSRTYRLYMDYCQHGNGTDLMEMFAGNESVPELML